MKRIFAYLRPYRAAVAFEMTIKVLGTATELLLPWMLQVILDDYVPLRQMGPKEKERMRRYCLDTVRPFALPFAFYISSVLNFEKLSQCLPARQPFSLYRPLFRLWGYTRFLRAFPLAIPHLFVRLFRSPNFTFSPSVFKSFAKHRQENTEDFASFDDKT